MNIMNLLTAMFCGSTTIIVGSYIIYKVIIDDIHYFADLFANKRNKNLPTREERKKKIRL